MRISPFVETGENLDCHSFLPGANEADKKMGGKK